MRGIGHGSKITIRAIGIISKTTLTYLVIPNTTILDATINKIIADTIIDHFTLDLTVIILPSRNSRQLTKFKCLTNCDHNKNQNAAVYKASFATTLISESYDVCSSLYHKDQDTIRKCFNRLPIATISANNQRDLKPNHDYANDKHVRILRYTSSTVLGITRHR